MEASLQSKLDVWMSDQSDRLYAIRAPYVVQHLLGKDVPCLNRFTMLVQHGKGGASSRRVIDSCCPTKMQSIAR